jgi:hypothetical protein
MKTIGVCAQSLSPGRKATFDALGKALGVTLVERTFGDDRNIDGWVVLAADRKSALEIGRTTRPCYVVLDEAELTSCGTSAKVMFANRPELAAVLRGRQVTADDAVGAKALPHWLPDVVPLALKEGSAVWARQERGAFGHHYVSLPPPELNNGEPLFAHFSGQRIASLLPLALFVRSLGEDPRWEPPPLRAAFMFDDPNVHWTSYGFIDYHEMVRHAAAGNYHVSVATIPLDAWFVHQPASVIFKENSGRISLLYHGNDHVFNELARPQSAEAMERLFRQAIGRITRMEARTGLEVARVMAPPHGACSETALAEMAQSGFEAVCVSRGSLRHHNSGAVWIRTIGMRPCDSFAGLPIIPRFGLSKNCRNDILIAALFRQPIVPMTHHQAVADGYNLLDETASFVNSLGGVTWCDMKTISRSLYSSRHDDKTLRVRMWSKRVTVPVPPGTTAIHVDRACTEDLGEETFFWRTRTGDHRWKVTSRSETFGVNSGETIEIASGPAGATATETHTAGRPGLAPVVRRLLTEVRDRALPSVHRLTSRARSSCLA